MFPFPRPKLIASVTVGDRGQIVIPSDARSTLGIEPGAKLLVFMLEDTGALLVTKPESFEEHAKNMHKHFEEMIADQDISNVKEEGE